MTIHFYINSSFPYGMAAAKRRLCYAKGLIAEGNKVDVVICQKCFEKDEMDIKSGIPEIGTYQKIPYIYVCGKFKRNKKYKMLRRLDYHLLDYLRSFFYALNHIKHGDVIYIYTYPILLQSLIILATKIKKAKIVKEICEHPSAIKNSKSKWYNLSNLIEYKMIMPLYDGFIPISQELEKFVNKHKNKNASTILIPILVDDDIFKSINFEKLKSPYDVPYIIHTGTMHEQKDSISKILHAFASYKLKYNSNIKLVFTGPQANNQCQYIPLIKELKIEKDIELLGLVNNKQVAILQHFAAMTIIYKSDNLQTRNCFPTKLGEMLISGVPVITTSVGDANLYLKDGINAFIFPPDDENKLINDMHLLLTDKLLSQKIGTAGKEVANKYFNYIYQSKKLSLFFNSMYNKK